MQKCNGLENVRSFNKTQLTFTSCELFVGLMPFVKFDVISGRERSVQFYLT